MLASAGSLGSVCSCGRHGVLFVFGRPAPLLVSLEMEFILIASDELLHGFSLGCQSDRFPFYIPERFLLENSLP